ncbi:MAG: DOMON domain-containing protein [Bacillota bacterium]
MIMRIRQKKVFWLSLSVILISILIVGCNNEENVEIVDEEEDISQESLLNEEMVYSNRISTDIDMDIFWEFNDDEDELYMMLKSPGSGWLSVGFDPSNRMADAKMIMSSFGEDGDFQLEEHLGTGPTSHEAIDETYITESTGIREEESSIAEFMIPLGENSRYDLEPGSTHEVIVAFHSENDSFFQIHSQRASLDIEF